MWIKHLSALNFKNYTEFAIDFSSGVNAFSGDNGAGKTNLLDAIHYLSLCKSYFNPIDSQQIKHGSDFFMLQGIFKKNDDEDTVSCSLKRNQKKQFKRNKKEYSRLADHIGLFPLVMISPNDSIIITEGSEERRRFMDNVISQTDSYYLDLLINYNRILQSRNGLLKQQRQGAIDLDLLSVYDAQLVEPGDKIYIQRKLFMESFTKLFNKHYSFLTNNAEPVTLFYESQLNKSNFPDLLSQSAERDQILERTTSGIHKDDLIFMVNDMPLKKFGSQGQQKSFLIALKLAQYNYLIDKKGYKPLLLLDDIFDKLDDKRIKRLMEMVSQDEFGQIFITHTNLEKIKQIFKNIPCDLRTFEVAAGVISETSDSL
jgi:DNA replication and repair protein RecF